VVAIVSSYYSICYSCILKVELTRSIVEYTCTLFE